MDLRWLEERYKGSRCRHGGKKEKDKGDYLDFSANVNPFAPNPTMLRMVRSMVADKEFYVSYPDSSYQRACGSISDYLGNVGKDNVILTNGTIELIKLFCEVFTKGCAVIPTPTFCEYERFSRINGADMVFIDRDIRFETDILNAMEGGTCENVGTAFICNPNNPTGSLIKRDILVELVESLERKNALLFIDEAFIDFAPGETMVTEAIEHENVVVGRSLTKILGIPGIRLGYGVACEKLISYLKDAQMPWSVNNLARGIAENISEFDDFIKKSVSILEGERSYVVQGLSRIRGIDILPSHSNFVMLRIDGLSSQEIADDMRRGGILVRRCNSFRGGDENSIRIAIRDREENDQLLKVMIGLYGNR
ncbi:MAG TPA: histidinol-phosphate transaminase [Candidatus Methanofastidiosa archaeon]|nr:histidinol-phosphate transaminase [Candidatus Methanofastidiosa archaeon]HPR42056.1 histidinol-phosphate transaminase [Candidatus Methanofastidiosa archaeon]